MVVLEMHSRCKCNLALLLTIVFPGDSDPLHWGTVSAGGGQRTFEYWSEQYPADLVVQPIVVGDRRFVQVSWSICFRARRFK